MKTERAGNKGNNELKFELKYCERCGGLWLRPALGAQVYCVTCGREMNQLPPASRERESARMQRGPRWGDAKESLDGWEGEDLEAAGGGA